MLIECPECHRQMSSEATSCPHCGYILHNPGCREAPQYRSDIHGSNEGCFLQTLNTGCAIIGVIIILGLVVNILSDIPIWAGILSIIALGGLGIWYVQKQ